MCRIVYQLLICSLLWVSVNNEHFSWSEEYEDYSYFNAGDEVSAVATVTRCGLNQFECTKSKLCIWELQQCDGYHDCIIDNIYDDSDELNCNNTLNVTCAKDEFNCTDGNCIWNDLFCNGRADCLDNSDEKDCKEHLNCTGKFRCDDGYCVRNNLRCDSFNDCPDGSDENEKNCESKAFSESECNNTNHRYFCNTTRCISLDLVCDSNNDCGDWSDEHFECNNVSLCLSTKCEHCKITPKGPVCYCPSGYRLDKNNVTCIDIDECQNYGICDQGCKNLPGSYSCFCHPDYSLQNDNKTCRANGGEATLLFSTTNRISGYHLDSQMKFTLVEEDLERPKFLAVSKDYLYWYEVNSRIPMIKRFNTRTHEKQETIVTVGLSEEVINLDVDWITGNVYFADYRYSRIGVCNSKGTHCTILLTDVHPRGFTLLPTEGVMYYYDDYTGTIQKAGMDGNNVTTVIAYLFHDGFMMHLWSVIQLVIDYPNNRLYCLEKFDSRFRIESVKLDGTERRIVFPPETPDIGQSGQPTSLVVFENKLYWGESNSVQSCDKFFGRDWTTLFHIKNEIPYHVYIDHSATKASDISNPCDTNPCEQLCLLNQNKSSTCRCSMGQELNADQHNCREVKKKQQIIIIAGNKVVKYYHKSLGKPITTTSPFRYNIIAAVYDQLTGSILAIDQQSHNIFRYRPENNEYENLISIKGMIVGGLAFDYIGNNVYLSNLERKSIEVYSLTTKNRTVFYFEEEPHFIQTVPKEGTMYVIFKVNDLQIRINKMQMNGLGEQISGRPIEIGQSKLLLYYDSYGNSLYSNIHMDSYSFLSYFSLFHIYWQRGLIIRSVSENAVSFIATEDDVFWTERNSNVLFGAHKSTGYMSPYLSSRPEYIASIIPINKAKFESSFMIYMSGKIAEKKQGCQQNNGNCSHVCLPSSPQLFICACPPGHVLSANNRTCTTPTACPIDEIKCSEHDVCITKTQWCDGHADCPNGEDEENNCKLQRDICKENCTKQCTKNQFECYDGKCISRYSVCDGYPDCSDYSDELNCSNRTCALDEFACDTGKCIPQEFRCDGENDCPDSSDERGNCLYHECGPDHFQCTNHHCISYLLRCNGLIDCSDQSDEKNCQEINHFTYNNCTINEYSCKNSAQCIPLQARCDGHGDCLTHEDEHNCQFCEPEVEFTCYDHSRCIPQSWTCDQTIDCNDGSDELNCHNKTAIEECAFKCTNGTCLSLDSVCNNITDCADGSDEFNNCATFCENSKCEHQCHSRPHGPICSCPSGYSLAFDRLSCDDINECELDVCSQTCVNTVGSFECLCLDGYVLRADKVSCKIIGPQIRFITATDEDIRNISSNVHFIEVVHQLMGSGISSIDSNALDDALYWSSVEAGTLSKINIKTQEIFTMGNLTPEVIAIDWITNNVYFNDNKHPNVIKICNLEQRKCARVNEIKTTAKVTALAVDPINKYLFWSQSIWRPQPTAEIYRSNLIGDDIKKIAFWNISFISGMAIDYTRSKLYWSDSHLNNIESTNLDGDNRVTFLHTGSYAPTHIDIFEDSIYWLVASSGVLQSCTLYGGNKCKAINIGAHNVHNYFTIFHAGKRPVVKNLCKKQHCDHMCILMSNNRTACICQDGKPVEPGTICPNANEEITFKSSKMTSARHEGGVYGTIIVIILVTAAILSVYYFYQKYKFKFSALNRNSFDSIRFQNPSFDRSDEVAVTVNASTSSNLHPGQHEYMNPVDEKLLEAAKESTLKRRKESLKESTNSEKKLGRNVELEKNSSLINLHM